MAKFLNSSKITSYLEDLINNASDRLVLISPYLKLNQRVKELLEDKNRLKIDVRIIYGKSELQQAEINWLKELTFVRTSFLENLHAKCYLNEEGCIITSLNLYEYSQVNNNEMGIYISKEEDAEVYADAYNEAQRIIRISDEVRISEVEDEAKQSTTKADVSEVSAGSKLPTYKLALKNQMKTPELLERLVQLKYLEDIDGKNVLTSSGEAIGGELRKSAKKVDYFIWPDELEVG